MRTYIHIYIYIHTYFMFYIYTSVCKYPLHLYDFRDEIEAVFKTTISSSIMKCHLTEFKTVEGVSRNLNDLFLDGNQRNEKENKMSKRM